MNFGRVDFHKTNENVAFSSSDLLSTLKQENIRFDEGMEDKRGQLREIVPFRHDEVFRSVSNIFLGRYEMSYRC